MRLFAPVVLAVTLSLLGGCSDDSKKVIEDPIPDPYTKPTSVSNVLYNLKLSYNLRDLAKYRECFVDEYVYVFDPVDVGGEHNIPELWGKADEILSAAHLFANQPNVDGYRCDSLSLSFTAGVEQPSSIDGSWRMVTLSQVQLIVYAQQEDNGEPLWYEVNNDRADLHFVRTAEVEPVSGERIWKIVYWVDKHNGAKASIQGATWGQIKAIWH
jgi:hypothetical protein